MRVPSPPTTIDQGDDVCESNLGRVAPLFIRLAAVIFPPQPGRKDPSPAWPGKSTGRGSNAGLSWMYVALVARWKGNKGGKKGGREGDDESPSSARRDRIKGGCGKFP